MENEKKYSLTELNLAMMDALTDGAWETPVEEAAHYVRAYAQLIDHLQEKDKQEGKPT